LALFDARDRSLGIKKFAITCYFFCIYGIL